MPKATHVSEKSEFRGFPAQGIRFLRDLAKNNERAWFTPRKDVYEQELLAPLRSLVADATAALRKARIPIGADPQRTTFRIYRDVRFSPDKRPYKTNLGAYLPHRGNREAPGGIYVHIQPGESFMAAAFYELDKPHLQRWREAMAGAPKKFEAMLRDLEKNGLRISEAHATLKRMPRGFEAYASSSIERYLRMHSFTTGEQLSDSEISKASLVERIVDLAKRSKPLLNYGWSVLEGS